jgi:hypothetical protein
MLTQRGALPNPKALLLIPKDLRAKLKVRPPMRKETLQLPGAMHLIPKD